MPQKLSTNHFNFFPPMLTLADAQNTAQQASGAAFFVAGMTTFVILLSALVDQSILSLSIIWGFIGVALYGVIAFEIYHMSRIAAICGFILYITDRIYIWSVSDQGVGQTSIVILLIFKFINGVRGTFAYHHLKKMKQFMEQGTA